MPTNYRYIQYQGQLYRATEKNFLEYMTRVRDSMMADVEFDADDAKFYPLGQVIDVTEFSSAEAEALLLGVSPDVADTATIDQQKAVASE